MSDPGKFLLAGINEIRAEQLADAGLDAAELAAMTTCNSTKSHARHYRVAQFIFFRLGPGCVGAWVLAPPFRELDLDRLNLALEE